MEKKYICICGKVYYNSQSFNAHRGRCKKYLGEEKYNSIAKQDLNKLKVASVKKKENAKAKKIEEDQKWIEEQHTCEFCNKIMTKKYGSGRFCSKTCSKKFSNSKIKKERQADRFCKNCNKKLNSRQLNYCSKQCEKEFKNKTRIEDWSNGKLNLNMSQLPEYIRNFLLEESKFKCIKCGYSGFNPFTGKTILHIHHKDGNHTNNIKENLEVLCPNCHAMTENFGFHKKDADVAE